MSQIVFDRIEKKYMFTEDKYKKIMEKLKDKITLNNYGYETICNIYYDNNNFDIARNSISKPVYKEKIRLRSYGVPSKEDKVFFEIKKKYNKLTNKRRIEITLDEFYKYFNDNIIPNTNKQILSELDYIIKRYELFPTAFVGYDRESYYANDDKELRITFDTNLRYRMEDLNLEFGDSGKSFFDEKIYIMEIKILGAIPLWLVKILNEEELYPTSFSKYGEIYKKEIILNSRFLGRTI